MSLEFSKSTDTDHEIQLDSRLVSAEWSTAVAYGAQSVSFIVITEMVGYGAPIEVAGKTERGKDLGSVSGVMRRNIFRGKLDVPGDVELGDKAYFEVKLPKHGLEGESERIPTRPPVEVTNLRWGAEEARRGDVLTLSADVRGVDDGTEVTVKIYEFDQDGAHDPIVELPTRVTDGRIELRWEYQYYEDTDEIPTQEELAEYGHDYNPPEYFFTVVTESMECGREQESGLLTFRDWLAVRLLDEVGQRVASQEYVLHLPDGQERRGTLDERGAAREEDIPPGRVRVEFPGIEEVIDPGAASDVT